MLEHLNDVEKLIKNGKYQEAKSILGNVDLNSNESKYKKFLIGLILEKEGKNKLATKYFLTNCFPEIDERSAKKSFELLNELGFKKESINFISYLEDFVFEKTNLIKDLFELKKKFKQDTVVAIHQPSYMGWLGYFHKIFYADKFIIHDSVQFSKNSFIKRVLIRKANKNESMYLSIPAKKTSDFTLIKDIYIKDDHINWREDHLRKIYATYSKSKFFKLIYPNIEQIYRESVDFNNLVELTNFFTKGILDILDIKKELYLSSDLLDDFGGGSAHDKNMYLCNLFDGSIYLSGTGAKDYQNNIKEDYPIKIIYQNIYQYLENNKYIDSSKFINGLSILDALFLIGPQKIIELFKNYSDPSKNINFLD